jgi:1-aminocyclopropane-1-carboxylate deaminase
MFQTSALVIIQELIDPLLKEAEVQVFIQREDLVFPLVPGNKWRKLKYNLLKARADNQDTLLTFGGPYSNHIAATAAAGKMYGFKTIGIIRGEEHLDLNPTLKKAQEEGMQIHYLDRSAYRNKQDPEFIQNLKQRYGSFYLIPEGGANLEGVKGCTEILKDTSIDYDIVCCPVGTGATLAGIVLGLPKDKKVIGFSSLKGSDFLTNDVNKYLNAFEKETRQDINNWSVNQEYHFGGYAKHTHELHAFIEHFAILHSIPLDFVYTGKMLYGIYDLLKKRSFAKGCKILVIHTGGIQGNAGITINTKA